MLEDLWEMLQGQPYYCTLVLFSVPTFSSVRSACLVPGACFVSLLFLSFPFLCFHSLTLACLPFLFFSFLFYSYHFFVNIFIIFWLWFLMSHWVAAIRNFIFHLLHCCQSQNNQHLIMVHEDPNKGVFLLASSGHCVWVALNGSSSIRLYHALSLQLLSEVNAGPAVARMLSSEYL
jgi:hypothetical protein